MVKFCYIKGLCLSIALAFSLFFLYIYLNFEGLRGIAVWLVWLVLFLVGDGMHTRNI